MDILVRQNAVESVNEEEKSTQDSSANQTDSGCETSTTKSIEESLTTTTIVTTQVRIDNDLLILQRDPETDRKIINKTAYAKLHRSLSPTRQLDSIKAKYENSENESGKSDAETPKLKHVPPPKLTKQEQEFIRNKSKLPLAKPRQSVKSEIILPNKKTNEKYKYRNSLNLDRRTKKRDENSNEVFRKNSSSSGEFITVVTRSESIETVDKLGKELDLFTMDSGKPKDKKRANSFRKIFSGKLFGSKEKKKKEETESLQQKKNVNNENLQNETSAFTRQSPYRQSGGNSSIPKPTRIPQMEEKIPPPPLKVIQEMEHKYAQQHVKEFNNIKQTFENPDSPVHKEQPVKVTNPGPMDFKKVANINKFIDTSSSASTMESDRENSFKKYSSDSESPYKSLRFADTNRNTPPRAQELRQIQDVRLVNPKALIPINSERPLPNPYQNSLTKPKISPKPQLPLPKSISSPKAKTFPQPTLNDTYGTVLDSLEVKKEASVQYNLVQKPPRSPSLEQTKLRLPPNRDIGPMSPRMRSPIPQHHVSAEKLIATELLRGSRSPTPTKKKNSQLNSSHQKLEISIDYPDNIGVQRNDNVRSNFVVTSKPPISRIPEYVRNNQLSPNYENKNNMMIYAKSQEPRPSEYVNIQRNNQRSPNFDNRTVNAIVGSQERLLDLQKGGHYSPNYENRMRLISSQEKLSVKSPEPVMPRANQISPNYDNRNMNIGSQERLVHRATPDHLVIQRNVQSSPVYDVRNLQGSPGYDVRNVQGSPVYDMRNRLGSQEKLLNSTMRSPTPSMILANPDLSSVRQGSSRSSTPVEMRQPPSNKHSPIKEEMRKSVEAYYWKEIKKLKEQENVDLYYYQMQVMPFGYAEDPISFRRSRSSSPSQRNGRRSLSLPREPKSQIPVVEVETYGRFQPTPIPEGRAVVNQHYQNQYPQQFRRNAPERRTVDVVQRGDNALYRPIFKRGSLTTPSRELMDDQQYKKVSFGNGAADVWPTKNGYTQNPPQRKEEARRLDSIDDDVFLPNPQQTSKLIVDGKEIYGYANRPYSNQTVRQDPPYYQNFSRQVHQEPTYGYRGPVRDNIPEEPAHLTRYNSVQLVEPIYGQHQRVSRRMSFDNSQTYIPKPQIQQRRQIFIKDDIYGYMGGYVPNDQQNVVYASRQSIVEPVYGYSRGVPRQITVRDKVCDMYGQIHDQNSPSLNVRRSGVMLGQLQPVPPSHPPPQNFVRNSRLTASANDMYKRYQNVDNRYPNHVIPVHRDVAPSRPLPPVPMDKKVYFRQNKETVPEMSDVQNGNSVAKSKKRGIFGK
ncbi:uncharacterized protein LOC114332380 [Diabrotica virgifera virgifera]|uniref:Uncharacterized protein n=1 Tax=Diabrotica virgifera virgifera TaxID=50390 RepID=A0ABM5IPB5_DIAVI|nr:uncharacterized protein LOC114332380 [Diabrotica virgifera virgifera]XP_028137978.2 uncharacterized protein LOC114332380 [Diabrotica virgifera virgifera]XP_028137986.2 uncharacterized protein LOC114332380 [Diabrotica virgifera virgifera]XP_028137994.2 uncharacterized protein LOC114332380 [Diabrotica virgifera virgifera]XP_050509255.1 uncharacterized protein LOC114332380 [Diabrotica virgifera virgifera]